MAAIQNQYGLSKLRVLTIDDEAVSTIKPYARSNSALFLRDAPDAVWALYCISSSIPLNYVIKPDGKVYNRATGYSESTITSWIDACVIGVEENMNKVQALKLAFSPNPFKVTTVISVQGIETNGNLQIQDLSGRVVKSFSITSNSTIKWDRKDNNGREVPVGMYFCKLTTGNVSLTQKLVVLK